MKEGGGGGGGVPLYWIIIGLSTHTTTAASDCVAANDPIQHRPVVQSHMFPPYAASNNSKTSK